VQQANDKAEILARLESERQQLEQTLSQMSDSELLSPRVMDEWTIKDILAHLADWEAHMLVWIAAGRQGDPVKSPGFGLTWEQIDLFNQRVYEAHRDQSLGEVFAYFRTVHSQLMEMVAEMPEEEMLTPGRYAFLGKDTVHGWLVQYADHDKWAVDHIQEWLRTRDKPEVKSGQ
jgi:hypothetical protein